MKQWIEMNQNELFFLLYGLKVVASGGNGRIYQYDDQLLAKVYLSFLGDVGNNTDVNDMFFHISRWCNQEKLLKDIIANYETSYERMKRIVKRLQNTSCSNLIKGGIIYQDFAVASLLLDYKKQGYVDYRTVYRDYSFEENYEILSKLQQQVLELMEEYIYPKDVKVGNVMVRSRDLDVRLIDLDDRCTKYENRRDYVYYAEVLNRLEKMKVRVLKNN